MPTALARPWPSGPVVVSTPGVTPTSGWPGRLAVQLAEVLQLVDRQVVAGQVQQRVQQHRAVAVRQHEAVAIGPVRIAPGCGADAGATARPRSRPCPSACRDGPISPARPRPWRACAAHWRRRRVSTRASLDGQRQLTAFIATASRLESAAPRPSACARAMRQIDRREDELHRELHLAARHDDRVRRAT